MGVIVASAEVVRPTLLLAMALRETLSERSWSCPTRDIQRSFKSPRFSPDDHVTVLIIIDELNE